MRNNSDTLAGIALAALERGADALTRHRESILQSCDPEAVHDMRVAIRQMRAAIHAAGAVLPKGWTDLDPELRWVFDLLGAVRDEDIAAEILDGWQDDESEQALREAIATDRAAAQEAICEALRSARYGRLEIALHALAQPQGAEIPLPAVVVAPDLVTAEWRRVRKARDLGDPPSEVAMHRLRRRAKRLRYTLELFAGLYGKRAQKAIVRLKELQDLLGAHQDKVMMQRRMTGLTESGRISGDALLLAERIARECAKDAERIRGDASDAFDRLTGRSRRRLRRRMERRRQQFVRSLRGA
jgi:CHAD domain-containing protein